jgi:hypothetical protein
MSIEAMKQALEVLETHGRPWLHHEKQYTASITSLRQAIEQYEKMDPVPWQGCDLDGMVEAFDRVIEAHFFRKNPFHNPIDADAQMALRILRGFIPYMKQYTTPQPQPAAPEGMGEFLNDLQRSRTKYPKNGRMFDGLMGEVDELRRAYAGDGDVRAEAFDVAVCAYRIATEGDAGGNTLLATPLAAQRQWVGLTDESVVSAAARVLSDRVAASCNVDREDHWKMYGNLCIEDAQAALEAADAKLREKNGGNT